MKWVEMKHSPKLKHRVSDKGLFRFLVNSDFKHFMECSDEDCLQCSDYFGTNARWLDFKFKQFMEDGEI